MKLGLEVTLMVIGGITNIMMNLKSGGVRLEIDGRNTEETIYVMLNYLLNNQSYVYP
jgi:hypothetical protein